jgi:geranylgeranyl pyrophosphate synthase
VNPASVSPAIDPGRAPESVARLLAYAATAIDAELETRLAVPDLPAGDPARRLVESMRHAALAPGKRLRPAVVLAACDAVGGDRRAALPAAVAVELLHSYTLVHDDLPAMDDEDERRGRPTVHRAYDEATAILAGDGLQTAAFAALADLGAGAAAAVAVLARRSGAWELRAGQALDLAVSAGTGDAAPSLSEVERIHAGKTGALFAAAAELGGIAGGAPLPDRRSLAACGLAIGIAFQYADDLDDGDFARHAAEAARRRAELSHQAEMLATGFGTRGRLLADLARWIGGR